MHHEGSNYHDSHLGITLHHDGHPLHQAHHQGETQELRFC